VANYFNGENTGITVTVPVANDASLEGGNIQISISGTDVTDDNIGAAHTIVSDDLINGTVTITITRAQLEAAGLANEETATITATITDIAGNTTSDASDVALTSDQAAPAITTSAPVAATKVNGTQTITYGVVEAHPGTTQAKIGAGALGDFASN